MAHTIGPVTATSASWKVMARAWRTARAPILISSYYWLANDQSASLAQIDAAQEGNEVVGHCVQLQLHPRCRGTYYMTEVSGGGRICFL